MKYKCLLIILTFFSFLQSCEKSEFLDTKPLNAITSDAVFTDQGLARASLLTAYGNIPKVFGRHGCIPLDMNARDAAHSFPWGFVNNLRDNSYNASSADFIISDLWRYNWTYIREANTFIQGVENSSFDDATKRTFIAEGKFLRGIFYLDLFRFFGGLPLISSPQALSDSAAYKIARSTDVETANFIIKDFTEAASDLPLQWGGQDRGRAEKGAALGMKARTLLYIASLKNDNSLFQQAAATAKQVMDLGRYALHSDYRNMFFDKTDANKEFMFFFNNVPQQTWPYRREGDWGDWGLGNSPVSEGGWGGTMPSQNIVDEFEVTDGRLPSESPLYNPQDPYANRDPRLSMSFYHQGSTYQGRPLEFYVGGKDYIVNGFTTSGYYLKKGIDEAIKDRYTPYPYNQSFLDPLLRYADVLLMYAEAQNEVGGPDQSVYNAVNQVRQRPGVNMPSLPAGLSQAEMRTRIRRERHIELNFEESWYHDVRRWGIVQQVSSGPVYGVKITKNTNGSLTYDTQILETRTFESKYRLFPIPQSERDKNPNLAQNAGY